MKTDDQIGIRVNKEFKKRVEKQAARERRSVSNLIINVLTDYLDRVERNNQDQ